MKIVIVGPAWPLRGGIANFNEALAKACQEKGHDVEIVSFKLQYPKVLFPGKTQYDEGPAPEGLKITAMINSIGPVSWRKTAAYINKLKPDLVLVRYWIPFMAPALGTIAKKIRRKGTPVIAITDNIIPHERRPGDRGLTRYFVKNCDAFIAMSRAVLEELSQFTSTEKKKFIPHPIYNIFGEKAPMEESRGKLGLDLNAKYVLFFGIIRKYKGLDLLIEAFGRSPLKNSNVRLVIAGEFYEKRSLYDRKIKELGLSDRVEVHDRYVPMEEVKYYFCAANLIAQPYRSATQSGVTQIAYHFERPMLVTDVGGLAEIIPDGKVGYVTKVDSADISNRINQYFLENKEGEFVENVKTEKKRFEWSSFVEGIESLARDLNHR